MVRFITGIVLVFMLVAPASAATYYVDYVSGDDTNNGTTTGTPWQHCPGDANATDTAGAATLSAGDTVQFNSTVVYQGHIVVTWSGTAGNVITYDGSTWGGARADIDGQNVASSRGFDATGKDYFTITGFDIYDQGGLAIDDAIWSGSDPVSGVGSGVAVDLDDCENVIITNVRAARCGLWQNDDQVTDGGEINGACFNFVDSSYLTVTNCYATKSKIGFAVKSDVSITDILITDCDVTENIVWGFDVAPTATNASLINITISNTAIHDYTQFDSGNWLGGGEKPHRDGIFLRNAIYGLGTSWTNVVIDGVIFYNDDTGSSGGGTACIYVSQGPSVTIQNCVFLTDPQATAQVNVAYAKGSGATQTVKLLNNSFFTGTRPVRITSTVTADTVEIKNNSFYRRTEVSSGNAISFETSGVTSVDIDYNNYWSDHATPSTWSMGYTGSYKTFSAWQALGYDANGLLVDPEYSSTTGAQSAISLRLQSTSSLRSAGEDLSGTFTTDYDETTRSAWDIGAYEYEVVVNPKQHAGPTGRPPSIGITGGPTTMSSGYSIGN